MFRVGGKPMAAVLLRSDRETSVEIPRQFARWATLCSQCNVHYVVAYGAEEARRGGGTNSSVRLSSLSPLGINAYFFCKTVHGIFGTTCAVRDSLGASISVS
jgi:hypothetical protein